MPRGADEKQGGEEGSRGKEAGNTVVTRQQQQPGALDEGWLRAQGSGARAAQGGGCRSAPDVDKKTCPTGGAL
eukprot:690784-Pelagomonas_calceolata.AAC.1